MSHNKVAPASSSFSDAHHQIPHGLVAKLRESFSSSSLHSSVSSRRPSASTSPVEEGGAATRRTLEHKDNTKALPLLDAGQCSSSSETATVMTTAGHPLKESTESFHSVHSRAKPESVMTASLTESLSSREQEDDGDRELTGSCSVSFLHHVATPLANLDSCPSSPLSLSLSLSPSPPSVSLLSPSSPLPSTSNIDARADLMSWIMDHLHSDSCLGRGLTSFVDGLESHPLFKSLLSLELRQRTSRKSHHKRSTTATTYLYTQLSPRAYQWIVKRYKATCPELVILLDIEEPGSSSASSQDIDADSDMDSISDSFGDRDAMNFRPQSQLMDRLATSSHSESECDSFIEAYQVGPSSQVTSCPASHAAEPSTLTLNALLQAVLFDSDSPSCPLSMLDFISTFDYYMNSFDLLKSLCLAWMIQGMGLGVEAVNGNGQERLLRMLQLWTVERPHHFYDSLEVLQLLLYFFQAVYDEQTKGLGGKALASLQELIDSLVHALEHVHFGRKWPHSIDYWRKKAAASSQHKTGKQRQVRESKSAEQCVLSMLRFADQEGCSDLAGTEQLSSVAPLGNGGRGPGSEPMEKRDALRVLSSLSLDEFVDYFATQGPGPSPKFLSKSWLARSMTPKLVALYLGQMEWCRYEKLKSWTFYQKTWLLLPRSLTQLSSFSCSSSSSSSSSFSFSQMSNGAMEAGMRDWLTSGVFDVQYIIDWFNRMTSGIASHILTSATLAERRATLGYWIKVGEAAMALGQYQLAFQVAAALSSGPLIRSDKLWKGMDRKTSDVYAALMALTSPKDRYGNYRQHLKQRVEAVKAYRQKEAAIAELDPLVHEAWPTLPFLGVLLSDLTFAEDGNPTTLSKAELEEVREPAFGSQATLDGESAHDRSSFIRFYSLYSDSAELNMVKLRMVSKLVHDFFEPLELNGPALWGGAEALSRSQASLSANLLQSWHGIEHYFSHHFPYETETSLYQLSYKWEPPFIKKEAP